MNNLIKFISLALLTFSINAHDEVNFSQRTSATINQAGDIVTLKGSWVGEDKNDFSYDLLGGNHFNVSEIKCYKRTMMCFEALARGDGDKEFNDPIRNIRTNLRPYKITQWSRTGIRADSIEGKNRRELVFSTSNGKVSLTAFDKGSPFLTVIFANPVSRIERVD